MAVDVSEKKFEATIEEKLLSSGYVKRDPKKHHDSVRCLDPEVLFGFIYATQAKEWEKLKRRRGWGVKQR